MVLNTVPSCPISPLPVSGIRTARSPPASRDATPAALRTGQTTARITYPAKVAMRSMEPARPIDAATTASRASALAALSRAAIRVSWVDSYRPNCFLSASTRRFPSSVASTPRARGSPRLAAATSGTE